MPARSNLQPGSSEQDRHGRRHVGGSPKRETPWKPEGPAANAVRFGDAADAAGLPVSALDERVAIVGTSGSGKTYAAKGLVEKLLDTGARVCIVDPLGVWWGLRAGADGTSSGYPVVVFGGRHADVPLHEGMGAALGRLVGTHPLACVVDLSELGGGAARRRFMSAFAEAVYEANEEPLHLVLDEADMWAPQRPQPEGMALLGRVEEIVRRGRVRGFIPWLISQRPAVLNKNVLSQADILMCMKLTSSQDRDAVGGWIEGQADRAEGKRILAELPRLGRGEGHIWAPSDGVLARVAFPAIRTYDSSRTPRRGERLATPRTLAAVDLSAIMAALAKPEVCAVAAVEVAESSEAPGPAANAARFGEAASRANPADFAGPAGAGRERLTEQEWMLTEQGQRNPEDLRGMLMAAQARVAVLEAEVARLRARLGQIMALAQGVSDEAAPSAPRPRANQRNREAVCAGHAISLEQPATLPQPPRATSASPAATAANRSGFGDAPRFRESAMSSEEAPLRSGKPAASGTKPPPARAADHGATAQTCGFAELHPAARKLLAALAQHAPARFTWGQAATLAGLKAAGGHYNAGRKQLRDLGLVEEAGNLVAASPAGLDAAGEVPSAPSTPGERLALWCERLPSPAPEMLRSLASHGGRYTEATELAAALGKKPTGGHWNSGLALLRNNGLVEVSGKRLRVSELFR